jgi:hypothetical protein
MDEWELHYEFKYGISSDKWIYITQDGDTTKHSYEYYFTNDYRYLVIKWDDGPVLYIKEGT